MFLAASADMNWSALRFPWGMIAVLPIVGCSSGNPADETSTPTPSGVGGANAVPTGAGTGLTSSVGAGGATGGGASNSSTASGGAAGVGGSSGVGGSIAAGGSTGAGGSLGEGGSTSSPPPSGADNRYCKLGDVPNFGAAADGPASLPQRCIYTGRDGTPSPGNVIPVAPGASVNAALSNAKCGDIVELQAGGVYGQFTLPAKACDAQHWMTIRTAGWQLSEGTRVSPALKSQMATIDTSGQTNYAIVAATGANHYRLEGLEVTRAPGIGQVYNLIRLANADHVVLDQIYVHGTSTDETTRGIALETSSYVGIVDFYVEDIFGLAGLSGQQSQGIAGGYGAATSAWGAYKIVNGFCESGGSCPGFGGGAASNTPADIEIRRNHSFKPRSWDIHDSSYAAINGHQVVVTNHLESKNWQRVLVEGNIFENTWGGFSQVGFSVLLGPKSQNNQCPACLVEDTTLRYNWIKHTGGAAQIFVALSDAGGAAQGLRNLSVHDLVQEDMFSSNVSNGNSLQISANQLMYLKSVVIRHVTLAKTANALDLTNEAYPSTGGTSTTMNDIRVLDSILDEGAYGVRSTGGSGCGNQVNPAGNANLAAQIIPACWQPYSWSQNVILDLHNSGDTLGNWPPGTVAVEKNAANIFVNYNGGVGGDYHVRAGSPYVGLGADIDAVNTAIAGVN